MNDRDAGSSFLDRMIKLVEGAERQKTPNEIALNILLIGLTIIFVFATATIPSYATYAGGAISVVILVALFVTLIPTTIGALLSAIGIAGMDRLVRFNVLAMLGGALGYDMPEYGAAMKLKMLATAITENTVNSVGVSFAWIKKLQ
jgi:high-affinity K+ transport system ATPase subunit B